MHSLWWRQPFRPCLVRRAKVFPPSPAPWLQGSSLPQPVCSLMAQGAQKRPLCCGVRPSFCLLTRNTDDSEICSCLQRGGSFIQCSATGRAKASWTEGAGLAAGLWGQTSPQQAPLGPADQPGLCPNGLQAVYKLKPLSKAIQSHEHSRRAL